MTSLNTKIYIWAMAKEAAEGKGGLSSVGRKVTAVMLRKMGWESCRLPECEARRDRWKQVEGPATAPPDTAGMTPTHLGCWDREWVLWAHLWKEEKKEWARGVRSVKGGVATERGRDGGCWAERQQMVEVQQYSLKFVSSYWLFAKHLGKNNDFFFSFFLIIFFNYSKLWYY